MKCTCINDLFLCGRAGDSILYCHDSIRTISFNIVDPLILKGLIMVDPDEKDSSGNNLPSRLLDRIVGPDKEVGLFLVSVF